MKNKFRKAIKSIKENYGGLPQSIYILFLARIINRLGGFVYAFLALYMKSKLGMTVSEIANYVLITASLSMISPFIGGFVADKKGRKLIYIIAQLIGSVFFILCGLFTESLPSIIPLLLIATAFLYNMVGPISNAMVADVTHNSDERRRSYSLLYLGSNIGNAIGPLLGGFLLTNYVHWFFYGDALTTILSVLLVAIFVQETQLTKEEMVKAVDGEKMEKGFTARIFIKKPVLLLFAIFSILSSAVYTQMGFGLSLNMVNFFGPIKGPTYYGMLISFNAIIVLLFTILLTELLRKRRPVYNIVIAAGLNTIGFGMIAFISSNLPLYFVSVFIWTVAEIIMVTNTNVFIMAHTPVNYRGRFSALIAFLMGIGLVISPKLMSFLIEGYSYKFAWEIVGLVSAISMVGFLLTGYYDKQINKL